MIKNIKRKIEKFLFDKHKIFNIPYKFIPKKILLGGEFRKKYYEIKRNQFLSENKIKEIQFNYLKDILIYSYENIKYYKKIFNESNFNPYKFSDFSEIEKIPILDTEKIIDNINILTPDNIPKRDLLMIATGGSTGTPKRIYQDMDCKRIEKAFIYNIYERLGYKLGDKIVLFSSRPDYADGFFKNDYFENKLHLSYVKINQKNIVEVVKKINEFKPKFLQVVPSVGYLFIKLMEKNKLYFDIKGIFCGSEKLFNFQRDYFKSFFNCKLMSWYGLSEYCSLAAECEISTDYHIFPEYGYTEMIKHKNDDLCDIVATGFNNHAMPLIRYKTGDHAIPRDRTCSCGRNHKLIKEIAGREQDYILTKEGFIISASALLVGKFFSKIKRFQLIQEKAGQLLCMIDPVYYKEKDEIKKSFESELKKRVGNNLEISISFDKKFIITERDKTPFMIQKLKIDLE